MKKTANRPPMIRICTALVAERLRDLKIPIGEVLTSPTYRALETVTLAQLERPTRVPATGDAVILVVLPPRAAAAAAAATMAMMS